MSLLSVFSPHLPPVSVPFSLVSFAFLSAVRTVLWFVFCLVFSVFLQACWFLHDVFFWLPVVFSPVDLTDSKGNICKGNIYKGNICKEWYHPQMRTLIFVSSYLPLCIWVLFCLNPSFLMYLLPLSTVKHLFIMKNVFRHLVVPDATADKWDLMCVEKLQPKEKKINLVFLQV